MPVPNDLLNGIRTALGPAVSPSLTLAHKVCDLYEAYAFALVIDVARAEGAVVTFQRTSGAAVTNSFLFRTGPTSIRRNPPDYCHALIQFPGKPGLEAHVGIYVLGWAAAKHEADVCVLRRVEAAACRSQDRDPRHTQVILSVECKMYSVSSIGVDLGRSFLGLTLEFRGVAATFVASRRTVVVEKLLTKHKRKWVHELIPSKGNRVNQLKGIFQTVFQEFKAKN